MSAVLILSMVLLMQGGHPTAQAKEAGARCVLYVVGASAKKAPLPKELGQFKALFSRMPFKMYKGFRLRARWAFTLAKGKFREFKITSLDSARVTMKAIPAPDVPSSKRWFTLRFELYHKEKRAKKRTYDMLVKLLEGKPMFVAGPEDKDETIFIGVVCR